MTGWTWETLVKAEPRLAGLEADVKAVVRPAQGPWCANRLWYSKFKPRLLPLVGWESHNSAVRASEAYDVAYRHLYALLPDCRDCTCL